MRKHLVNMQLDNNTVKHNNLSILKPSIGNTATKHFKAMVASYHVKQLEIGYVKLTGCECMGMRSRTLPPHVKLL